MTEDTAATVPDLPPQEPNAVDAFSALSGPTSGEIFFERTGGGRGPGWHGDTYMGRRVQLGPVGAFRGDSVEQIYTAVSERAGGGRYRWVGRDQAGKPRTGEVYLPGEPKLLSVEDPAAAVEALASDPGAPFDPRLASTQPLEGQDAGEWVWSFGQQRYRWTGPGAPPGPPPRYLPGAYQQQSPYDHSGESALAKELRAVRDELAAVKAQAAAPKTDPMAFLSAFLSQQQAALAVQAQREATAAKERLDAELAFRREQLAAQERMLATQQALQEKALASAPKPTEMLAHLETLVSFGKKLAGVPEEKPEEGSKIGEKVVSALEQGATALAAWAKQPKTNGSAAAPEPKQITTQATVKDTAPGDNGMAGIDDETRQWIALLKFTAEQYQSGIPGRAAWFAIYAHCRGSGVDVEKVVDTLSILTGTALVNYMRTRPEPLRSHLSAVADAFATADGSAWLDGVLQAMREHANGNAAPAPEESESDGG